MSLTLHDIERLAQLSRLQFEPPAAERLLGQLNGFFEIVEQMRAVDTSGVVPMAHPVDGFVSLTEKPGLGLEPDINALQEFRRGHQVFHR